jgi:metallo-beta-lactamase class B
MFAMPLSAILLAAAVAEWNRPVEPFKIAGNLYYVGANEITSFLIATPEGHIVLDGGFEETAPQILGNIRKLGFKPEDVRVLINSQAHYDHAAGFAALKKATGARLEVMAGDAEQIERGGIGDFAFGDKFPFPPTKVDRILHDGDTVSLGGATLKAVLTAGHTPGCTTWTMTAGGKRVVFVCSVTAPGYTLTPPLVEQYRKSFQILKALPCDIFLGSHGGFFDLDHKRKTGNFVDPDGYRQYLARSQAAFEKQVTSAPH